MDEVMSIQLAERMEPTPEIVQETAISLSNVRVAYRSYKERPSSLKESLIKFLREGRLKHYSTFDALNGVSFEIPRGTTLGIIGSNGSGKSTLLKVLAQVLKPTEGLVRVKGSVASLIELGAGFDPELNAVENIYLNGSLHKRNRKEIKERVDQILDFAELTEFANTPVKYFSSGMFARLGFSAAIDIDPDILLIDEILSVGDERFNKKCKKVFENFFKSGKTIVLVSHDLELVSKLSNVVAVMSRGQLAYYGDPQTAVKMYRDESYLTALT
jgi:ABC-type polysaccharide/polyol phosphate transport system ATPase subunit